MGEERKRVLQPMGILRPMTRATRRFYVVCLATALWCAAFGAMGQITVLSPKEIADKFVDSNGPNGFIPGSTGTFGEPSFGQIFEGRLWYVDSPDVYCTPAYTEELKKLQSTAEGGDWMRNVFLVRRGGGCSFVSKVLIAEKGNADAVIIVDFPEQGWTREDLKHIIMSDDGHGAHVRIPSIFVTHKDGEVLIEAAKDTTKPVIVKLGWSLPQRHVVGVHFWTDSGKKDGVEFLRQYAPQARALSGYIDFTTHYNVFSLPVVDGADMCLTNEKKYCGDPPPGQSVITGREVLLENLRQICLWKATAVPVSSAEDSPLDSAVWWEYVKQFPTECPSSGALGDKAYRLSDECSVRLMKKVGADVDAVERCATEQRIPILDQQLGEKAWSVLALRINDARFSGNLEPDLVTRAICSAFLDPPPVCATLLVQAQQKAADGLSMSGVFALFGCLVCGIGVGMFLYQRYIRRTMRNALRQEVMLEVKAQMQEYHQMGEDINLPEDFRQSRPLVR